MERRRISVLLLFWLGVKLTEISQLSTEQKHRWVRGRGVEGGPSGEAEASQPGTERHHGERGGIWLRKMQTSRGGRDHDTDL